MPVHLFNFHGYRTWMPDHPKGYTRHGEGVLAPDFDLAAHYYRRSRFDTVRFDARRQRVVVDAVQEVCSRIDIKLYYAVCVSTHAHALVGWKDAREHDVIYDRIKRIMGYKLSKAEGVVGRRWLAARRAGKQVRDEKHFKRLMIDYLPNHRGITWADRQVLARVNTRGH
ncbi:MAG TPA: hypothetical protein VF595_03875 [Tepidisphaeraceae bacterium]|jgi:hypothetical protein